MKVDCQISDHGTFILLNFATLCNLTNELILYDRNPAQAAVSVVLVTGWDIQMR
jgi:hypothetical protein